MLLSGCVTPVAAYSKILPAAGCVMAVNCSPNLTNMAVTPRLYCSAMADKYASKARRARRQRRIERCGEKRSFPDEQSARCHNRGQRPYRCNCCGSWHLASYKVRTALRSPIQS